MAILNGTYRKFKLPNGLVVALQNTPTQTIAANLRVNYGSSHEKEGEEGLAHFLEHCLITGGSRKYDPVQADELRGLFGYSNALTNIGRTFFIGEMLSEDLERWLDFVSQHVFHPRFERDRVNGERERVLREISDVKSNPIYETSKEFNRLFYRNHPKGRSILGSEDVVKTADIKKIQQFHNRGFHPNNMDLIIAGGLPENTRHLIEQYFGDEPAGENTRRKFPNLLALPDKIVVHRPAKEILNLEKPEESSAQILLAYIVPSISYPDSYAIRSLSQILGGDTNSRLFQSLGLKKGLAYNVNSNYDSDYNVGELNINASVPATRIEEAVSAIFDEFKGLKTKKVEDKHIERIKRIAKYVLAKAFDSNKGHISAIEGELDDNLTLEKYMQGFNSVTADRIFEIANKYLPDRENGKYVLFIRNPLLN
jgi:predicted Zn-dependent peptidase